MDDQHKNPDRQDGLDSLERQIRDGRGKLDFHAPRLALWDKIEQNLDAADAASGLTPARTKLPPKIRRIRQAPRTIARSVLYIAASLLMVAGAVSIADRVGLLNPPQSGGLADSGTEEAEVSPLFTELQDVETYYYRLVDDRSEEIRSAFGEDAADSDAEEALAFLDELAQEYEALQAEAGLAPEKVLAAMINNYRQRIEVLERMSSLLEDSSTDDRENPRYENYISL